MLGRKYFAVVVAAVFAASCGGDDDTSPENSGAGGSMSDAAASGSGGNAGASTGGSSTGGSSTGGSATGGSSTGGSSPDAGEGGSANGGSSTGGSSIGGSSTGGSSTGGSSTGGSSTGGSSPDAGEGGSSAGGSSPDAGEGGSANGGSSTGGSSTGGSSTGGSSTGGSAGSADAGMCTTGAVPDRAGFIDMFATEHCESACVGVPDLGPCTATTSHELDMLYSNHGYDPAQGAICEASTNGQTSCPAESCSLVFPPLGTAALGGLCDKASDCAPVSSGRVECNSVSLQDAGGSFTRKICQQIIEGVIGGACNEKGNPPPTVVHECVEGKADCIFDKCQAVPQVGDTCSQYVTCGSDLVCKSGHCAVHVAGDPCTWRCSEGLFCNASDQCEALHADGAACADDGDCASNFCDGLALTCRPKSLCMSSGFDPVKLFREQQVTAFCEKVVAPLCTSMGAQNDLEWCKSVHLRNILLTADLSFAAIPAGAVLDAADAAACLSDLQTGTNSLACSLAVTSPLQHAPGESCLHKYDCKVPGDNPVSCQKDVCVEEVQVSTGAACDQSASVAVPPTAHLCDDNNYCDTSTKLCMLKKASGAACTQSNACQKGLDCVGSVCTALTPLGGNCVYDAECTQNGDCVNGKCRTPLHDFVTLMIGCAWHL